MIDDYLECRKIIQDVLKKYGNPMPNNFFFFKITLLKKLDSQSNINQSHPTMCQYILAASPALVMFLEQFSRLLHRTGRNGVQHRSESVTPNS